MGGTGSLGAGVRAALIAEALAEARRGVAEGGMPFGAVLADAAGVVVARGHNRQIQSGRWLAHAETECLAGYLTSLDRRADLATMTLVATEAPCPMCAGAAVVAGVGRVLVGEAVHYAGALDLLRAADVPVEVLDDAACVDLVTDFRAEHADRWARFSAG